MLDPIEAGTHSDKRLPQGGCPDPVLPMSTSRSAGRNVSPLMTSCAMLHYADGPTRKVPLRTYRAQCR